MEYYPNYGVKKCDDYITRHSKSAIAKKANAVGLVVDLTQQRLNLGIKKLQMSKNFMIGRNGYVMFVHPETKKRVPYHRYVMEIHIGRKLDVEEIVHHKDGDKYNNAIDNLEIVTRSEHMKLHQHTLKVSKI